MKYDIFEAKRPFLVSEEEQIFLFKPLSGLQAADRVKSRLKLQKAKPLSGPQAADRVDINFLFY